MSISVTVDHEPLATGPLGLQTVGQVLSHLQRSSNGRLVVNLLIDGEEPDLDRMADVKRSSLEGHTLFIDNPAKLPAMQDVEHLEEPMLICHIHVPNEFLGAVLKLCQDRRGTQKDIKYLGTSGQRVQVTYEMLAVDRAQTVLRYWNWSLSSALSPDLLRAIRDGDDQALDEYSTPERAAMMALAENFGR